MSRHLHLVHDGTINNGAWDTLVSIPTTLDSPYLNQILIYNSSRLFPFMVVSSALAVFFIFVVLILIARQLLLPGILILGSFILFVLFLTGLVETSLQLYAVEGNINSNCQIYVEDNKSRGNNINTLAWLTQITICEFFFPRTAWASFLDWLY